MNDQPAAACLAMAKMIQMSTILHRVPKVAQFVYNGI